ncbi:MAG TPA: DUF6602 domain-containing protein [Kofleriaceae bacterium]|nr:DUF6602 domain-containing protein [Kofleriaceae bacterium]
MSETFAELLVQRLKAQASLLQSLTGHPTLVGNGRESAFRQLLHDLVPRRYEVLEGTIAGDGGTRTRRQVDCMIVDTFDFPTLFRSGSLAVVLRHAVRAIVELKGTLIAIGKPKSEAFQDMLIQIGRTKDQLQLGVDVITGLFIFSDQITTSDARTWLGDAVTARNEWAARGVQKENRGALMAAMLPNYIVTSEGIVVEKLLAPHRYRFYNADAAVAVAFLVANLLQAVALPPQDAEHYGIPRVIDPANPSPTSKLAEAYTEFATHFGSPTLPAPSGPDLDLTDPQPLAL